MNKKSFSIGDLAKLYGLSKQTLFYYERVGLLVPEKLENGYRAYSEEDGERLEIIVSLKKLNISLQTIGEYIKNPSVHALLSLYEEARGDYEEQIETAYNYKLKLENAIYHLKKAQEVLYDQIFLEMYPASHYYTTPYEGVAYTEKEMKRNLIFHKKTLLDREFFSPLYSGFLLEPHEHGYHITECVTYLELGEYEYTTLVTAKGLFLSIYLEGPVQSCIEEALKKMESFMQLNELVSIGPLLIEPISNFWTVEESASYSYSCRMPVQKEGAI